MVMDVKQARQGKGMKMDIVIEHKSNIFVSSGVSSGHGHSHLPPALTNGGANGDARTRKDSVINPLANEDEDEDEDAVDDANVADDDEDDDALNGDESPRVDFEGGGCAGPIQNKAVSCYTYVCVPGYSLSQSIAFFQVYESSKPAMRASFGHHERPKRDKRPTVAKV